MEISHVSSRTFYMRLNFPRGQSIHIEYETYRPNVRLSHSLHQIKLDIVCWLLEMAPEYERISIP